MQISDLREGIPFLMPGEKREAGGREAEPMETEQELTVEEYEHLLAQYENSFKNLQEGQIIRGRVLTITPSEVIVDIGYKSEGIIPLSEFTDFSGQVTVKPGDAVDVLPREDAKTRTATSSSPRTKPRR